MIARVVGDLTIGEKSLSMHTRSQDNLRKSELSRGAWALPSSFHHRYRFLWKTFSPLRKFFLTYSSSSEKFAKIVEASVCWIEDEKRNLNFKIFALINALWCLINAQLPPQLVALTECVRVDCEIEWKIGKKSRAKVSVHSLEGRNPFFLFVLNFLPQQP